MKMSRLMMFLSLVFIFISHAFTENDKYNILFIQSYTPKTLWNDDVIKGLEQGLSAQNVKANITVEYLDADYWNFHTEKEIMRRFCERGRERGTDLIVTSSDEALYTLMSCGDSLGMQKPVVYMGVKYPNEEIMSKHKNISGFTTTANFTPILELAHDLFPKRHEVICIVDSSFLASQGKDKLQNDWIIFSAKYPYYSLKIMNSQSASIHRIITLICNENNSHNSIVLVPKWSPFLAFIGRNSKAPLFTCQNISFKNGVLATYDANPYQLAYDIGIQSANILKGAKSEDYGRSDYPSSFNFDYKQLDYFKVESSKIKDGEILNIPFWEKYRVLIIVLNTIFIILLVVAIIWLFRGKRRESFKRLHAQSILIEQNHLVSQRDEFDNIFHSLRDALITYDVNLKIQITNRALLQMLHLPLERTARFYEGTPAGSLFKIYSNGKEILLSTLELVLEEGKSYILPADSFLKEVYNDIYFPISGELVPIRSKGKIAGVAFSCRNVSEEEMQKRFFNLAVEDSSIYPWQFNIRTNCFTFPLGFLKNLGFGDDVRIISRVEMENLIYPNDFETSRQILSAVLAGKTKHSRMIFRMRNSMNEYEWWEFRTSVFNGLTTDAPYSIIGVCQSIQRYKQNEEELIAARDKALETDKLKSAFLANMSHEIRTPLNAIVGFSDLLNDTSLYSDEEVQQFIGIINKNCGLLLALINDILDLSRIESGSMEFVFSEHNLPLILKNVFDSQRINMPSNVKLLLNLPEGDKKYLVTDNIRLQQVINNLINNAAKFTEKGTITLGYTEVGDDQIEIFVEDTGCGISEESIHHIFDRFYKADNFTQGAGLGLSICQTIVSRLNGTINVYSCLGKGTRFVITIPTFCM